MSKKITALLLIILLCFGSLTAPVFADPSLQTEEGLFSMEEDTSVSAEEDASVSAEEDTFISAEEDTFISAEEDASISAEEDASVSVEEDASISAEEEILFSEEEEETGQSEEETEAFRIADPSEDEKGFWDETAAKEDLPIETDETEEGRYEIDNNELLYRYLDRELLQGEEPVHLRKSIDLGSRLSETNKTLYDAVKEYVHSVAEGTQTETVLTVPFSQSDTSLKGRKWYAEDLGIESIGTTEDGKFQAAPGFKEAFYDAVGYNASKTVISILRECPYEMFWFGNVYQTTVFYKVFKEKGDDGKLYAMIPDNWTIQIRVSPDYSFPEEYEDKDGTVYPYHPYKTDPEKIGAVNSAVANAQKIVSDNTCTDDYDTLYYYFSAVSALSDYNHSAASSYPGGYGDPWQLIWLFDGDPDTKVLCEGYAKGMQYLCDMTEFKDPRILCYCVTGTMLRGKPGEAGTASLGFHMWNIVHMDDGYNYLIDATNSRPSAPWGFLAPYSSGSLDQGYTIDERYTYLYDGGNDESTPKYTWLVYTEEELILSGAPYAAARTPADLTAAVSGTNVTLKWECTGNPDGFYISRSENGINYFDVGRADGSGKYEWTDESVSCGAHYYRICSYVRREGGMETESEFTPAVPVCVLQTPKIKSLKNAAGGITVSWTFCEGADGYKIFYSVNDGAYKCVRTITSPSVLSWNGSGKAPGSGDRVKVKIRAYKTLNGKAWFGPYSEIGTIVRLEKRTVTKVSNTLSGRTLRWDRDKAADGYIIYRKLGDGAWTSVKTVKKNTTVKWMDPKNTAAGKKYSYKVASYKDWNGVRYLGAQSSGAAIVHVPRPVIRSFKKTSEGVTIAWKKAEKAEGYSIYRSINGGAFKWIRTIGSGAAGSFTDKKAVDKGKICTYRIVAFRTVSGVKYRSFHSIEKSIKIS